MFYCNICKASSCDLHDLFCMNVGTDRFDSSTLDIVTQSIPNYTVKTPARDLEGTVLFPFPLGPPPPPQHKPGVLLNPKDSARIPAHRASAAA